MEERLITYLKSLKANGGSDLHLKAGAIVRLRINGLLKLLGDERMTAEEMILLANEIMAPERFATLEKDKNLDFTYILDE